MSGQRRTKTRDRERRRQEREAREREAQKAAARKRRLELGGGVAIAVAMVGGIAIAMQGGGASSTTGTPVKPVGGLPVPPQRIADLDRAVTAAGCVLREFESEGQDHTDDARRATDFKTNPATSGAHHPVWAQDGYYRPGDEPGLGHWVHALEHGRVLFQYRRDLSLRRERQLRTLFAEDVKGSGGAYHALMFRNNTTMRPAVAAVAWTRSVTCSTVNDRTFDALRAFREKFVDRAPEKVP